MVNRIVSLLVIVGLVVLLALMPAVAFAQDDEGANCQAGITIDLPASGISLESTTTTANLNIVACNGTDGDQLVKFSTSGLPDGWTAAVRPMVGMYLVTSKILDVDEPEELQLRIRGPRDQKAADFVITLQATSEAGDLLTEKTISVVRKEGAQTDQGEVTVTSNYPFLSGPNTNLFEFEIAVVNNTPADVSLNLQAFSSQGWQVQFLPAYGAERLISNVSIVSGLNQKVKVRVAPPRLAEAGDYPILVRLANETETYVSEIPLQVSLTGNFDVVLGTPDGRLNVNADAGEITSASVRIFNSGTAELQNVSLLSDAPADWQTVFQTELIELLPSNNMVDVLVDITPPSDAVPGDYMITLRIRNNDVQDTISLRVTVEKSTIWQWIGIGIVAAVIVALVGMFVKLGRR